MGKLPVPGYGQTGSARGALGDPSARVFEVFLIVSQSAVGVVMRERVRVRELHSPFFKLDMMTTRSMGKATKS